ncbi:MAG: ABC transporter permease, partial [Rhizobiales bacterium]|nr:ABC transporter permease [Rhizobacter sp.]
MTGVLAAIGLYAIECVRALGHHAFFFWELLRTLPASLRRPYFAVVQVHALGNLSLLVILSSGLAVGFVLALQTYYALVTYGAADSVGLVVNLSLVR